MWLMRRRKEKAERKIWNVDKFMAETPQTRADLSRDQSTMIGTATTARKIISGFSGLWHESCRGGTVLRTYSSGSIGESLVVGCAGYNIATPSSATNADNLDTDNFKQ
jgi:hypothetical protein